MAAKIAIDVVSASWFQNRIATRQTARRGPSEDPRISQRYPPVVMLAQSIGTLW
jgi:hypothetical protein